jgi:hypothetical protein
MSRHEKISIAKNDLFTIYKGIIQKKGEQIDNIINDI